MPNVEIAGMKTTPARLEIWENNEWKFERNLDEVGALGEKPLQEDRKYRLFLYGNLYRTIEEFGTVKDKKAVFSLARKDRCGTGVCV